MVRLFYLAGGYLSLALGTIGAFLPVLPTVPFMILAAFCFARSSPELERRLVEHPILGPHILRWREHGAISRKGKVAGVIGFGASAAMGLALAPWPWSLAPVAAALVGVPWLWLRPEE